MAENTSHVFSPSSVVGFEDDALNIMERLIIEKPKQLDVISIVGMAGIGKTTLALRVYNNDSIAYHFYIRSWISVSQSYQKRDLLLGILNSPYIHPIGDFNQMSDDKLSEALYKRLKGNRCLIVMDDMWSTEAWDDLKRSFPNDNNGSKVMFTSRIRDVALRAKPGCTPYELRFLSKEESWDLLQEKIFHSKNCPPELMEVGKEIAEKCDGLPLAIVVISGLLAKIKKNEYQWKQVAKSMGSYIASNPKQYMKTLELSYNHLPNHLRPLFLYFGAFPEDYDIPVFNLIWLWIGERFVEKNGDETLEDTAVDYLIDLIGRSLILVSKRSCHGEVKSCRVHDLLRDLCLSKAKEENFMLIWDTYNTGYLIYYTRRLFMNNLSFDNQHPFIGDYPKVCSLLIHRISGSVKIPMHKCFRFLHVIDIKDAQCDLINPSFFNLNNLRYLAFQWISDAFAQSISELKSLEILICHGQRGKDPVKMDIGGMTKLRHFKINKQAKLRLDCSALLVDLQTITIPSFTDGNYDSLKYTPNLRELRCNFYDPITSTSPGLELLVKLETLNMGYYGSPSMTRWLDLPSSLKKLTLSHFCFDWKDFSKLVRLHKLEALKLLLGAFKGECWDSTLEESNFQFPELKFLKFAHLDFVEWSASKENFPKLQRLVLNRCEQLKEIPSDIGDIPTLEIIEVTRCSRSTAESARQILEEQKEMGNEQLKISVYPPDW